MPARKFTDDQEAEIVRAYVNGGTALGLSKQFGCAVPTIIRMLERHNIEQRSSSDLRRHHTLNTRAFNDLSIEHPAYWYGFIWADGTVAGYKLILGLKIEDVQHVERLKAFLDSSIQIKRIDKVLNGKLFTRAQLAVSSRYMAERLRSLGIIPCRSSDINPLEQMPEAVRHHWIRGLIDGDGSARKDGTIAVCGSQLTLEAIRSELARVGLVRSELAVSKSKHAAIYNLYISGDYQARRVRDYLYSDATIWLSRKRTVMESWGDTARRDRK